MGCPCEQMAEAEMVVSPVCIGHLWVFQNLEAEELSALAGSALRRRREAGEMLFFQGDRAKEMLLIKAGRVKLIKNMADGAEITLDIRKAGDFLGENIFSDDPEYPVSARCMEDTLTCGFTRDIFEGLVFSHPNIGLQVIRNLSNRISWLTTRVEGMTATNLSERLYQAIAAVADEHGVKSGGGVSIPFPLTHEDLGFLVGAHRVSVTRAMKELKAAGKIIQEGRRLILPSSPESFTSAH